MCPDSLVYAEINRANEDEKTSERNRSPDVDGATSYVLQVSASSDFANMLVNVNTTTSFYDGSKLPRGVVLYWQVRAFGQIDPSLWSGSTFRIK